MMPIINRSILAAAIVMLMTACGSREDQLGQRAAELCRHLPDNGKLELSERYLTRDFYAVLDTLYALPDHEAMDHEWLHYFVTSDGSRIEDVEVETLVKTDPTHALATILVRQKGADDPADGQDDAERHLLAMEKVGERWLLSDFDHHKEDCMRHIAINRKEQQVRDAIGQWLVENIGSQYRQGERCIPTLTIVAAEEADSAQARVWCDAWIWWYDVAGDTLKTVSGGNHSGCMTLLSNNGRTKVTAFEQTADGAGFDASARRIFGSHYDVYQRIRFNHDVQEAVRREQLREYVKRHKLAVHFYQDYGREAVGLQ